MIRRAVEALHYFRLTAAAELLEDILRRSLKGEDSDSWPTDDDFDDLIDGDVLETAFRAQAREVPADFRTCMKDSPIKVHCSSGRNGSRSRC